MIHPSLGLINISQFLTFLTVISEHFHLKMRTERPQKLGKLLAVLCVPSHVRGGGICGLDIIFVTHQFLIVTLPVS